MIYLKIVDENQEILNKLSKTDIDLLKKII